MLIIFSKANQYSGPAVGDDSVCDCNLVGDLAAGQSACSVGMKHVWCSGKTMHIAKIRQCCFIVDSECNTISQNKTVDIYTTKIDGVVCPPNISETVAGRLMKLAHRPRIASTMIKLISKPILLPILLILVKTIQRIVADLKRKLSP